MKIGFAGRMMVRPVGQRPVVRLDNGREAKAQRRVRMNGGQVSQKDAGVEFEPLSRDVYGDSRRPPFIREWPGVTISAKGVDTPFARRREVEFMVCGVPVDPDESLEAGMPP